MGGSEMKRGVLFACAALVALSCASKAPPTADATIDWQSVADVAVPEIVTRDPDGGERVTKLWIAVVDGVGVIRTGDSRWFRNIERDPNVVLRIGGYAHPLRAEIVDEEALEKRANAAFREKYGWQDWLIHPIGEPDSNLMRLVPRE
jgi:hypothetical protein